MTTRNGISATYSDAWLIGGVRGRGNAREAQGKQQGTKHHIQNSAPGVELNWP